MSQKIMLSAGPRIIDLHEIRSPLILSNVLHDAHYGPGTAQGTVKFLHSFYRCGA